MLTCPVCKQGVAKWRGEEKLNYLQTALDVHMTAQGSLERPAEDQAKDVHLLKQKVAEWRALSRETKKFDSAVRRLLVIAVEEAERTLSR